MEDASLRIDPANTQRAGDTTASRVSLESPNIHGLKRSADGSVKASGPTNNGHVGSMPHKRNKSMESSSRIGAVRATLSVHSRVQMWLTQYAAFRTIKNTTLVRHGEGSKWLGTPITRGIRRTNLAAWLAEFGARKRSTNLPIAHSSRTPTKTECYV
jgi:hypothetical protein